MENYYNRENTNSNIINKDLNIRDILISLLLVGVLVSVSVFVLRRSPEEEKEVATEDVSNTVLNLFNNLDLEATSIFVWDVREQSSIYSRNSESQLPLASLTKVAMALVAYENAPEGLVVTIKETHLASEGDNGLFENEKWTLKNLVDFSLIVSSNDGAMAIASAVGSEISQKDAVQTFIALMNKKAKELGLTQTYFTSPSGLDKEDIIPGGSGSARDVTMLFEYILKNNPEILEATSYNSTNFSSLDGLLHEAENTNNLVQKLPGIIASKTGFTDLAGGNLVVAYELEPGHTIIISVLGSSMEGRFLDIEKLYLTTLDKFSI